MNWSLQRTFTSNVGKKFVPQGLPVRLVGPEETSLGGSTTGTEPLVPDAAL